MSRTITNVAPDLALPPEVETPPKARAKKAREPREARVIENVAPDLQAVPQESQRWYWIGVRPESPRSVVDVAGLSFCKITEKVQRRGQNRETVRTEVAGTVLRLSDSQLERLAESLRRLVVRYIGAPAENIASSIDRSDRPSGQALVLKIPTPEEIAARRSSGSPAFRPFEARVGDTPLAKFLYLEPCTGTDFRPRDPGRELPRPISETGVRFSTEDPADPHVRTYERDDHASLSAKARREGKPAPVPDLTSLLS